MSQPQLQVCRTCLQVIDNQKYCVNLDASDTNPTAFEIKSKLEACVPELTISVVKNPVICGQCIASLDTAFAFKRKCVDVEERIYDHLLDIDSHVVNLEFVIEQDIKCKIEPMILEDEDQFTNKVCNSTENYLNGTPTILECHTEIQNNEESHPVDGPPNGAFLKRKPNGILNSQTEVLVNPSSSFPSCFVTLSNLSEEFLKLFKSDSEDKLKNTLIHEAYSEKNDKFICFICEQNFKTKNQLKEHESTHGSQATFYICYPYEVDRESIKMHLYRRLSKTSKRYQCGVCFSNIYGSINAHLRSHMNKDLRKCKFCRLCRIHKGRRKHRKSSLVQQKKPLEKQLVQQKKPLEKQLVQQKKPLEKQKFSCDTCEFFTINKNLLVEHVKTHRKTVSRKHQLEQRKKPLENQKPVQIFSCVTCGFLTVHKDLLTKHVETHKETPLKRPFWKCSLCGSNIASATELTKHVTCEHPGDNFYKCGVCDFVIDRVDRLKYHMRIHNGMKAFTCMLCKFRTDVRREFNEHSTIHTIAMDQRTGKGADNTKQ